MKQFLTMKKASFSPTLAYAAMLLTAANLSAQTPGFQFFGAPPPTAGSDDGAMIAAEGESLESGGGGGVDLGIFARKPFTITVGINQGFDSNPNTTQDADVSSWYTNVNVGLRYMFGTPRLQLAASLGGGYTYYYNSDANQQSNWNGALGISATYLATDQLVLTFSTSTAYLSQPDISLSGGGTDRDNGDYFVTNTTIAGTYQWTEKFSTTTSYNISANVYTDEAFSNDLSYLSQTIGQSLNWLVRPKTVALVEYRINPINYYNQGQSSLNNYFLVGVDQVFNPRLSWNARVGAQVNFEKNPIDGDSTYVGPYFETNLSYQFGPASTLAWVARYGTETSGIVDVNQRQTFRTGFNVTHAFTPRLTGNLGAYWLVNYYAQSEVIDSYYENIFTVNAGLSYAINRFVSVSAGYQFTLDTAPEWTGNNYSRNVVFGGVNFTF
jgi:hypothetical protein